MKKSKNINISISQGIPNQGLSNQWLWELLQMEILTRRLRQSLLPSTLMRQYVPFSLIFPSRHIMAWKDKENKTKMKGHRSWEEKGRKGEKKGERVAGTNRNKFWN